MSYLNPSDAVAQQENLARQIFDELRTKTFDGVGITRVSYGEGEQTARNIMANVAKQLGMTVEDDPAGNVYMTLKGRDPQAKPVVIGSHIDSVAQGGNFDGAAGVVSGLIACAGLIKAGIKPPRDIKVMGIRAGCKGMKTRYAKPFEGVQIKIPYETGMDPYSGLLEMLETRGIVDKVGNKLSYVSPVTGEEIKEFRKGWSGDKLQIIIDEWSQNPKATGVEQDLDVGDVDPDEFDNIEELMDES